MAWTQPTTTYEKIVYSTISEGDAFLLEDDSFFLLEDGSKLLIEGADAPTSVYAGFGIRCDNTDIYCDSEDYYCDGSVVMWDMSFPKTITYQSDDMITDGALENWTGNDLDSWSKAPEYGTSTVTKETSIVHGSLSSAKITVSAAGNQIGIAQVPSGGYTAGSEYTITFWAYGNGTNSIWVVDDFNDIGGLIEQPIPPAAWTEYTYTWIANDQSDRIQISNTSVIAPSNEVSWSTKFKRSCS